MPLASSCVRSFIAQLEEPPDKRGWEGGGTAIIADQRVPFPTSTPRFEHREAVLSLTIALPSTMQRRCQGCVTHCNLTSLGGNHAGTKEDGGVDGRTDTPFHPRPFLRGTRSAAHTSTVVRHWQEVALHLHRETTMRAAYASGHGSRRPGGEPGEP